MDYIVTIPNQVCQPHHMQHDLCVYVCMSVCVCVCVSHCMCVQKIQLARAIPESLYVNCHSCPKSLYVNYHSIVHQ